MYVSAIPESCDRTRLTLPPRASHAPEAAAAGGSHAGFFCYDPGDFRLFVRAPSSSSRSSVSASNRRSPRAMGNDFNLAVSGSSGTIVIATGNLRRISLPVDPRISCR